jgi:hypothetical protein
MHYLLSFLTSMTTIVFVGLFTLVCFAAVVYLQWVGFVGAILVFGSPGMVILYGREKRRHGRNESMEVEDKIGYQRMKSGVDYFEKIWRREKKNDEE